jgi:hypothetical protein
VERFFLLDGQKRTGGAALHGLRKKELNFFGTFAWYQTTGLPQCEAKFLEEIHANNEQNHSPRMVAA